MTTVEVTALEQIFVTVKDAAKALSVSPDRIYQLLNAGRIEGRYDGSKRLVYVSSVRAYADALPSEREAP